MVEARDVLGSADAGRDPRLGYFASGGELDGALPSARVLGMLECLSLPSGPEDVPFAGATHDEAAGMLAAAAAVESHASALKLAAVREIVRRHAPSAPGGAFPDPGTWRIDTAHEVAAILRISVLSAAPLADLAWQFEARLPGTGDLLDAGVLSFTAARIVAEEFSVLDDIKVMEAEKLLLGHDLAADDMTPGKIRRLCQRIADTVDPVGAAKRREQKQRDEARVRYFRDHGGAAALYATGLPPDDALRSESNVQKRAIEYRKAGIREKMDVLRVLALADFTNGIGVPARHALWLAEQAEKERAGDDDPGRRAWEEEQAANAARERYGDRHPFPDAEPPDLDDRHPADGPRPPDDPTADADCPDCPDCGGCPAGPEAGASPFPDPEEPPFPDEPPDDLDDRDHPGDSGDGSDGPADSGPGDGHSPGDGSGPADGGGPGGGPRGGGNTPGGAGTGPAPAGMPDPGLPSLLNLTLPLATVLGQADRPGEAPGYGSLDPALTRNLAAAAAQSPRSRFCVTLTDEDGHASAHGCARLIRDTGRKKRTGRNGNGARTGTGPPGDARDGPPATGWGLIPDTGRPGPDGGYGSWILTLPTGARYRVAMHTIPLRDCDHRSATGAYRPGELLRHLVQVRDGECTFTACSHPAKESDYEHTIPHHEGGPTCGCNGTPRSRRCHRVKQMPEWTVTQPEPGWHRWEAPSGRSYTKGPKNYPA